jgi:hypothetical protein
MSPAYQKELIAGLQSAVKIVNKHASGDHAAMVVMRLEQAIELIQEDRSSRMTEAFLRSQIALCDSLLKSETPRTT